MLEITGGIILAVIILSALPLILMLIVYLAVMIFGLGWIPLGVFALFQMSQGNDELAIITGLSAAAWGYIAVKQEKKRALQ